MNILVRVPNWLGDTMMATPAVGEVKKIFPKARVTVLAKPTFADFWRSFPGVEDVIVLHRGLAGFWGTVSRIKQGSFDLALVLPTSFSSAFMVFAAEIPSRIGWGGEGRNLFLTQVVPHPEERQKHLVWEYLDLVRHGLEKPLASKIFKLLSPVGDGAGKGRENIFKMMGVKEQKGLIAMSPGAAYGPAKRWPLPYWREVICGLLKVRKESILILGGLEEEDYLKGLLEGLEPEETTRIHWLVGRTTPLILADILTRCKLLVTNDTGPMHVAAAVGTPTVALFGSTSPTWTRPFGLGHEVIYHQVECSPCFQKSCPIGYLCLNAISTKEVLAAVLAKLKKPSRIKGESLPRGV